LDSSAPLTLWLATTSIRNNWFYLDKTPENSFSGVF
jgi:hypothetical protein